ncbi:hypothetical protein SAMN05660420_01290 [Desulfuromusa kysingii]|uniref:Uncharacterized protein n=1 Tax=Desulfuromusa kysingii TaxID=37625 RepID=A0A1H3YLM1_9BACT|nr:hypothetical protein SAMN05660420_01290 [Desulfuromusa kysingii]
MSERSEFLPLLKAAVEWREPAGQGGRVCFFAYFLVTQQESEAASGAATPRPYDLSKYCG